MAQGQPERDVLDRIIEEFVQYNRNAGRGRDAVEDLGLLWFYSYKLRIMKVAMRLFRERPIQFATTVFGMGPLMNIDTAASGSLAGVIATGDAGYSFGWGMGLNAINLHPVVGAVN
jgi:hypothetical protein